MTDIPEEECAAIRQVLEVSERHVLRPRERSAHQMPGRSSTYVASHVFLLSEDDIIDIELRLHLLDVLVNLDLVRLTTTESLMRYLEVGYSDTRLYIHFQNLFVHERSNFRVKVEDLDRRCLLKSGFFLDIGGDKAGGTLVGMFLDQVASDGARLVEDEAIVVLVILG